MHKLAASLLFALIANPIAGLADGLVVTPQRVVLEGREREAKITLSNLSDRETTYRLYFVNYRMGGNGEFIPVTKPTDADATADRFVRFSPRQVQLAAGETQIVRLLVRMPGSAPAGEYRSHLVMQAIPPVDEKQTFAHKPGRTQTSIRTLYGVSIPVIIRRGRPRAEVQVLEAGLQVEGGEKAVRFVLSRSGDASTYGDITVYGQAASNSTWYPLAQSLGVAIYPPLTERAVRLTLRSGVPEALKAIRVEYVHPQSKKPIAQTTRRLR